MGFEAKIVADSISPQRHRLTTFEVTFPRFILAEFNTHRVFSRNSASSRAIPIAKQLRRIVEDPYVPIEFGSNQPGMQAGPPLEGAKLDAARECWLEARDSAVRHVLGLVAGPEFRRRAKSSTVLELVEEIDSATRSRSIPEDWLNVHKQVANRVLEPFMWHTVIVTATEWENFWNLRAHAEAQPEIRRIASDMRELWHGGTPVELRTDWHLPLVDSRDEEITSDADRRKVSVGRCARVSYLTHNGTRDPAADIELHDRLIESGHMSPLEHPARPMTDEEYAAGTWSGNYRGWHQYRKDVAGEANPLGHPDSELAVA